MGRSKVLEFNHSHFARWTIIYALAIAYVSTALGPTGFNFVPLDPAAAWRVFLKTPYLANGSDQRADWMGNLTMFVPLGFLATGAAWSPHSRLRRYLATVGVVVAGLSFILIIKYGQLFFPPRTVSINYILAQSFGLLIGIILFPTAHPYLREISYAYNGNEQKYLKILLSIYTICLLLFYLFPFDFVLTFADVRERLSSLPHAVLSLPGGGMAPAFRVILLIAEFGATVPLGMLLRLERPQMSLFGLAIVGFTIMSVLTVLTMFVMSTTPTLIAIVYRTAGVVAGGVVIAWINKGNLARWQVPLTKIVPVLVLPYVMAVLFVGDLLTPHWQSMSTALGSLEYRGLLPFYHHYIVSKAHAAESVVVHFLTFAPIGVMISLRHGNGRAQTWAAALLACSFSIVVELGRWLKVDLQPDFSDAIIAAIAGGVSVKLTDILWRLLEPQTGVRSPAIAQGETHRRDRSITKSLPSKEPPHPSYAGAPRATVSGVAVALICFGLVVAATADYPLPWALGAALAIYAVCLWRCPSLWLLVVPAVLPSLDLAPWTGWMYVSEPDLFILMTIGVLAIRAPPQRADLVLGRLPAVVLSIVLISYLSSVAFGLALPGLSGGSDNPYLRPDNALRLATGFALAFLLLPFLRERFRSGTAAMAWFGGGMTIGLGLVAAATLVERAVFPGIFDFSSDYRVVATFSSMHLGGGYIGAYIAMALPFLLACLLRPKILSVTAMLGIVIAAGYALVVSFARAAYAAALLSTTIACVGWIFAVRSKGRNTRSRLAGPAMFLLLLGAGIITAAFGSQYMEDRLKQVLPDFTYRETSWRTGMSLRENNIITDLFGMGLGTYPRVVFTRKPNEHIPANFVLRRDGAYVYLSLIAGSSTYFGQKVPVEPDEKYRLFGSFRSTDGGGTLTILLCEKLLLYSTNCRGTTFKAQNAGRWEDFGELMSTEGFDKRSVLRWLRRPVELSLFTSAPGTSVDVGHIRLLDQQGRNVIANGDFSSGTARWFFTDDDHIAWRIKNEYLMTLFESGALGVIALTLLVVSAFAGSVRAIARGERMGAVIAASLTAFLCSGLFDNLLESQRLSTLFYLIAFSGILMSAPKPQRTLTDA